jgi:hypothetical protein
VLLPLLLASLALAGPADLAAALDRCARDSALPLPPLSASELDQLGSGKVVRRLHHDPEHPERDSTAIGWMLTSETRHALWVAAEDPHTNLDKDVVEVMLQASGPDRFQWYGFWNLPLPMEDRQWVVDTWNNHDLAARTGGTCWEHVWELAPGQEARVREAAVAGKLGGVTPEHVDRGLWIPATRGGWTMIQLPDGRVLAVYQTKTVPGGVIPEWVVQRGAVARLEGVMREAEHRARTWVPRHFQAGHEDLCGGDGVPIPPWP